MATLIIHHIKVLDVSAVEVLDCQCELIAWVKADNLAERVVRTLRAITIFVATENTLTVCNVGGRGACAVGTDNTIALACGPTSRCTLRMRGIECQERTCQEQESDEDTQSPIATTCSIAASVAVRLRNTPFPTHNILANSGQNFPDPAEQMLSRLFRFCCWD
ncbi:MAG: hypothetical protein KJ587_11445 [Alphaproteobacteria bacterium]|nr:hypothetical protein [Alphaproteobacteria bacterium]